MNSLLKRLSGLLSAFLLMTLSTSAAIVTATFDKAIDVPVTAASYTANGNTVNLSLNFPPPTGTNLTIVNNTGTERINGTFANLLQGQAVTLRYGRANFRFVANYYGGDGNDLVLIWEANRLYVWGSNSNMQLGLGDFSTHLFPYPGDPAGLLTGKTILALSNGQSHAVALCTDGTLAAWGKNSGAQLGTGTTAGEGYPVLVDRSGVLAGKTVTTLAAGISHTLALCSDNTLVAWGSNQYGQLGNGGASTHLLPVAVTRTGALAGKTVVAIAAGDGQGAALCSDGTLAAWGLNAYGSLGNGATTNANVPQEVPLTGALAGKTVVAIASGYSHFLALCADGTLVAWGRNYGGQLGNNTRIDSSVPVKITTSGILAGKKVSVISAGYQFSVALCTDGTIATWGANGYGELGNGVSGDSGVPVAVVKSGVLTGKKVVSVVSAESQAFAICSDGSIAAWGNNQSGELGNNGSYFSRVPVLVSTAGLAAGEKLVLLSTGPGPAFSTAAAAKPLSDNSTLGSLVPGTGSLSPAFASGITNYVVRVPHGTSSLTLTPALADANGGLTVNGSPLASGIASQAVPVTSGTVIAIDVTAQNGVATNSYQVTVREDSTLSSLGISAGTLEPVFSPDTSAYAAYVSPDTAAVTVTPTATDAAATIRVNGSPLASATESAPIALVPGSNVVTVSVTAPDATVSSYTVDFFRQSALRFTYTADGAVPVTAADFVATRNLLDVSLGYAPAPGTDLTVVKLTGDRFISGRFANLAQGQVVVLTYNNARYKFVANYHGGTGNDLVLQWAHNKIYAWGYNIYGQLGIGAIPSRSNLILPVDSTGVLAGKTVTAIAGGFSFSLALCSDGTLFAWGDNTDGQLGNGTTTRSNIPAAVIMSGAFAGKTPVAISAGSSHCLVLCSDGSLASWGKNKSGELGNGTTTASKVPVLIPATGLLATKVITDISAGSSHNLVRCEDGALLAWGDNTSGELGISSGAFSANTPVAVDTSGVLAGKTPIAISAGYDSSLVACSDGTLVVWGRNYDGELGNGTYTPSYSSTPVEIPVTDAISGKIITAVSAGYEHSLVLCSDGAMAAWGGDNNNGELGNGTTGKSLRPVAVTTTGLLSGKSISFISANNNHNHVLCADGTLASWGYSQNLGNGSNTNSTVPVAATIPDGVFFTTLARGPRSSHNLVVGALPLSDNSALAGLTTTAGSLDTAFSPLITIYTSITGSGVASATVTPAAADPDAIITVNGKPVASGAASSPIELVTGNNSIVIEVTAETGTRTAYTLTIVRPPLDAIFDSAATVPVTDANYSAQGNIVNFSLNFTPTPGTILTVVNNTGLAFIGGTFGNLAQGQHVPLTFAGVTYDFVANYFGGTGNDLVLQWAATGVYTWGSNNYGQLGDNSTTQRLMPTSISDTGALSGKTVTAVAEGYLHSLALCSDGTLASWGYNIYGQLGNDGSSASSIPVEVDQSGALAGKTVIAISAGPFHNLALCSDGSIAAWGYNNYGQLGTGDKITRLSPVLVISAGALIGKQVVGVAAGAYQSFARCADGSVVAWGYNDEGELGDNSTVSRLGPVAVDTYGALANKKIATISAGQYHTMALFTDGTLIAWGYNQHGELGNDTVVSSQVPVAINSFGALAGKTVSAISAGGTHSLALCTDGSLAAWGFNNKSQLGVGGIGQSTVPVAVTMSGKTISTIAVGGSHSMARFTDGSLAAWGDNATGQLGNNTTTTSEIPTPVDVANLPAGSKLMLATAGSASLHSLSIIGLPQSSAASGIQSFDPLADQNHDGILNLIVRAFALSPIQNSSRELPQPQRVGDNYVIEFTEPKNITNITYGAESSVNLKAGSWVDIPDTGSGSRHIFSVPADDTKLIFFRLKVSE